MSRRLQAPSSRAYPWTDLDPERRNTLLLYAGIGVVVLFALALIAYGYYADRIAPQHETVLRVGERKFDVAYLENRTGAEVRGGRLGSASNFSEAILQALSFIEREEIARIAAKNRGASVTDAEIDGRIRERLGMADNTTREQLSARPRFELQNTGLSLGRYREIARAEALELKLRDQLQLTVPAEIEHADLRLIQLNDRAKADAAKARLDKGDGFTLVAVEVSVHPSKSNAGQLGWVPRGTLPRVVDEAIFSQPLESASPVIETDEGFFIVLTRGRETREVSPDGRKAVVDRLLTDLYSETREAAGSEITLTADQIERISLNLSSFLASRG